MSKKAVLYCRVDRGASAENAHFAIEHQIAYSAAKAAVKNLSASMAAEFAAANIRVLAYVPGMIATEIAAESIEKYGDALLADIPCRRFGTPEDLGKVLVFLASDAAGYMNGCHVEISGGKRCVQNPQFSYQ